MEKPKKNKSKNKLDKKLSTSIKVDEVKPLYKDDKKIFMIDVKNIFVEKFKKERDFLDWWFIERNKYISQEYRQKPVMKLLVDNVVLNNLIELLKLKGVQIFESEKYPTPSTSIETMIRNYKVYFYN